MVDTKTEGYLAAAIALIPIGISMISGATEWQGQLMGVGVTALGLVAIYLRGQHKDAVAETPAGKAK